MRTGMLCRASRVAPAPLAGAQWLCEQWRLKAVLVRCGRFRAAHAAAGAQAAPARRGGTGGDLRHGAALVPAGLLAARAPGAPAAPVGAQELRRRAAMLPPGPLRERAAAAFDLRAFDAALYAGRPLRCLAHVRALAAALDAPEAAGGRVQPGADCAAHEHTGAVALEGAAASGKGSGAAVAGGAGAPALGRGPSAGVRAYVGDVLRGRHQVRGRPWRCGPRGKLPCRG